MAGPVVSAVLRTALLVLALGGLQACAYVSAIPVDRYSKVGGIRIYDVKPLLLVNGQTTELIFVPNYNRAYALRFGAFLAKNDFQATMANGILSTVHANMDSTEFIKFLIAALDKIPGARSVSDEDRGPAGGIEDRFQVYDIVFDDNGNLIGLKPLVDQRDLLRVRTTRQQVRTFIPTIPEQPAPATGQEIQPGPIDG